MKRVEQCYFEALKTGFVEDKGQSGPLSADSKTQGKCQLSVKFSAICQLSLKILAICQLSVNPIQTLLFYETSHNLKSTNVKMPPDLSMTTGFGLVRNSNLIIVILTLMCVFICCAFAGDSYQESKPGNEKRKSQVNGSYHVTKHRRKPSHSRTKRKSPVNIRIQKALWKLNNPFISKEVKGNAFASKGKSCRPETVTAENQMRVMTSQHEISSKNHICSVKRFSSRGIIYQPEKKFIGTSGMLA